MDAHNQYSHPLATNLWLDQLELAKSSTDSLGRESFASTLADAIVRMPNDRSVVTAVFGPWGCGKTWLLERIVAFLEEDHPATIDVCRFSPWELKSHDQILGEFFQTIAAMIPPKGETRNLAKLWEQLEQFTMIGSLGAGGIASAIMLGQGEVAVALPAFLASFGSLFAKAAKSRKADDKPAKKKTLGEVKNELAEELQQKLQRPILIIIDDLDRLTHGEIQMMIRLLNTTANLPKLHYLIFGDRQQIASALDPVCGDQGDRYLEKLVQNSFQVPEPGENQIRLRIWEGLEKLAKETNTDLPAQSQRFSEFWNSFLKFRISNLRDCHRLLRTLTFHTGALTQGGTLEVDLLDLLGIDFLRVFDPPLYHRLATDVPTWLWCRANLSTKNKDADSKKVLDLVRVSVLGEQIACGALISLFPHLSKHLRVFLEENQLQMLLYGSSPNVNSPLGICNIERSEIYFRLNVAAGDLPEAKVKEFSGAMADSIRMYKLLEGFKARNWLSQLFGRLKSDPQLIPDAHAAARILLAISSISDELEYKSGPVDHELGLAYDLSDYLIDRMAKDNAEREVLPTICESGSFSLSLLLLEQMRDLSDCTFFPGSKPPVGLIKLPVEEIEALADELLPGVSRSFCLNHFMKEDFEALRAYRMAHALGPIRTEEVLDRAMKGNNQSKIWKLLESIAASMMPSIRLDSWEKVEEESAVGFELLGQLMQFASIEFWKSVVIGKDSIPLTKFSQLLVPHLESAIRRKELEGRSPGTDSEAANDGSPHSRQ